MLFYQIFPLENQVIGLESTSPESKFDLFEGDIAGINGFDVLAGQEVREITFILGHWYVALKYD